MYLQDTYVNNTEAAKHELARIQNFLDSGEFKPLVSFDLETRPGPGLEAYPTTVQAATGVKVTVAAYKRWVYWVLHRNYDSAALQEAGYPIPNKFAGKFSLPQFQAFADAWAAQPDVFAAARLPDAELDPRYIGHVLRCIAQQRAFKYDPVKPGLSVPDTEIFLGQFSLQHNDGRIFNWVINAVKVDLRMFTPLLERKDVTFIGHNIKFDLSHTQALVGIRSTPYNTFDTQVASRLLKLGLKGERHDLAAAIKNYCPHLSSLVDKAVRATFIGVRLDEPTPAQLQYSFVDTHVLFALREAELVQARKTAQVDIIEAYGKQSWIASVWQTRGYKINVPLWLELTSEATLLRDEAASEVEKLLLGAQYQLPEVTGANAPLFSDSEGDEDDDTLEDTRPHAVVRLSQRALVAELFAKLLNLGDMTQYPDDLWSDKTGKPLPSLSEDARSAWEHRYVEQHGETHPFFKAYSKWSAMAQIVKNFGLKFTWYVHPITGRLHPTFVIAGTETGRFTSNNPNFLNFPRGEDGIDVRQAIETDADYEIGGGDFSTFEARAAAEVSGDLALQAIFKAKADMHSASAVLAFHTKRGNVKAPERTTEFFVDGTRRHEIDVWVVPQTWSAQQYLDFVLSKDGLSALLKVAKLDKNGNPLLDDNGEIKYEKPTRQLAKIVNFLRLFGGGPYTLAQKVNITVEQAEDVLATLSAPFGTLNRAIEEAGNLPFTKNTRVIGGRALGFIQSRGGIRRWFVLPIKPQRSRYYNGYAPRQQDWEKDEDFATRREAYDKKVQAFVEAEKKYRRQCGAIRRQAFNVYCQGLNAEVQTYALNTLTERFFVTGILPFLSVYDEIKVLVPLGTPFELYKREIETAMIQAGELFIHSVPIEVEADPLANCWKKF